jgi:hypothetical protein
VKKQTTAQTDTTDDDAVKIGSVLQFTQSCVGDVVEIDKERFTIARKVLVEHYVILNNGVRLNEFEFNNSRAILRKSRES